ncbi:hypothetical protein BCE_1077 [Bacillus cereus ATCC 10987]|uniref:Uncharacterized protein n=2 Tax=Bacillus cereus group TaxID=86661 RepID=Q73CI8_BACC1|nr:hypothetical protein BCE_1077 [Bacillus cereus ATCC 10987]
MCSYIGRLLIMRFNKYTVMLMFLAIGSNAALSMWLKQGLLGVITAIVLLLIAAWTTKRPHTDNQHK